MSARKKTSSRLVEDRLKDIQHEVLVAVASGLPLTDVMALLCTRAEEVAPKAICSIIRVDSTGRLRPLAAPSLPAAFSQGVDGLRIGPMVGSCGSAAFHGVPVEVVSIKTDPRWAPYKEGPLALGLKACWSSPIKSHDNRVIGTFAFYFRTARRASNLEKRIVGRCAHLCALAIEHWAAQNRVRRLAYTDALTGLGNRALVSERLPEILDSAAEAGKQVALFSIDLDGFRTINTMRGQKIGDELLREMGRRIRDNAPGAELVARIGGDEFLVVQAQGESSAEFGETAERLCAALSARYALDRDAEIRAAASIGIACYPEDGDNLDSLLGNADTALRSVKSKGRACHLFYTAKMDAEKRAMRAFERDISMAACAGQLSLAYQPQADADTCKINGFEALLRWNHPIHGFVPPTKFIPAAEASGAIIDIGAFVLRQAMREAARWKNPLRVAVNVSPAQIVNADFAELVQSVLAETGVDPARLEIEVTESLFIYDSAVALKTLEAVKALGVSVAIDDFGTGYSCLSTLRSFPFDRIKIDRSFVFDMVSNKDAAAIVESILSLGRAMERPVIAEGVETDAQLGELQRLGCAAVQGYMIGKPLPIDDYAEIVDVPERLKATRRAAASPVTPLRPAAV